MNEMSDWLEALAQECRRTSQAQVARRLKVSPAMINLILKGAYPASSGQAFSFNIKTKCLSHELRNEVGPKPGNHLKRLKK